MNEISLKISDVAMHLQTLANPKFSGQIQQAVEKKDKNLLIKICNKAKIPAVYTSAVVSTVISVSPQKWPEIF